MTQYDISYRELAPFEADRKAVQDIRDYLDGIHNNPAGAWDTLRTIAHGCSQSGDYRAVRFWLSFVGVQGYPVNAFIREHCPETVQDNTYWHNDNEND